MVQHIDGTSGAERGSSADPTLVGWLENTRMSTQPICYLYWKE